MISRKRLEAKDIQKEECKIGKKKVSKEGREDGDEEEEKVTAPFANTHATIFQHNPAFTIQTPPEPAQA